MLTGKKINIITDRLNGDYSHLIDILQEHHANVFVTVVDDTTITANCCEQKKMCDCVIFDTADPLRSYSIVKRRCLDFASIVYIRSLPNNIVEFDWSIYKKFDSILNSINNYPYINGDMKTARSIYSVEVIQAVCSAISVHKRRKEDYQNILKAFVDSFYSHSDYITFVIISEAGKIVATDKQFQRIFGNKNGCWVNTVIDGAEIPYSSHKIGKLFVGTAKDGKHLFRMINSHELFNGEKYFLETWEICEEAERLQAAIARLDEVNQKLQTLIDQNKRG